MNNNSKYNHQQDFADVFLSRRDLLSRMGNGFAGMSLASMLAQEAKAQEARKAVQKPLPAPVNTKARMDLSALTCSSASMNSLRIASLMALRLSGRFRVKVAIWFPLAG
jgi:hypothetical protein